MEDPENCPPKSFSKLLSVERSERLLESQQFLSLILYLTTFPLQREWIRLHNGVSEISPLSYFVK